MAEPDTWRHHIKVSGNSDSSHLLTSWPNRSTPPIYGIAIPIAPMFYSYRRVSHYTLPPEFALWRPRGGGGRGYRSSSCPLESIALYRGITEIVSPIAVSWATPHFLASFQVSRFFNSERHRPHQFVQTTKIVTQPYMGPAVSLCGEPRSMKRRGC